MNSPLLDLLDAIVSMSLDPNPIRYESKDDVGVEAVARACQGRTRVEVLDMPLNRNAFLHGCFVGLHDEPVEHLIVGLGHRHGSTTKVSELMHVVGGPKSVSIPDWVTATARAAFLTDHSAEVLWVHNHPKNLINNLIDNTPIASVQDRHTLVATRFDPAAVVKLIGGGGQMKFYLVENGFVGEFKTPSVVRVAREVLQRLNA